jgi:hypothetical protein
MSPVVVNVLCRVTRVCAGNVQQFDDAYSRDARDETLVLNAHILRCYGTTQSGYLFQRLAFWIHERPVTAVEPMEPYYNARQANAHGRITQRQQREGK